MSDDDALLEMAGGDPALAKLVRASLERLRDGTGDERLKELARDVLAGRTDLRSVASTETYSDVLADQFRRLREWREQVGDEEYERQAAKAQRQAEQLRDE